MSRLCGLILLLFAIVASAAGSPTNDNFANGTLLEGSAVTFSGNVAGSTREPEEYTRWGYDTTIWWSWTASETGPVTIQLLAVTNSTPLCCMANLTVYGPMNLDLDFPTKLPWGIPLGVLFFDPGMLGCSLVFTGYAGSTYKFQLGSMSPQGSYAFGLIATNAPIIFRQPRDIRVSPGQCALFTVDATGVLPLHYQWQFNGSDIPGATLPFFGLTNAAFARAGDYSVVVSNATGVSTSSRAQLSVSQNETSPALSAAAFFPGDRLQFAFQGEPGRYYRIETSTNLDRWVPEAVFSFDSTVDFYPAPNPLTSVFFPSYLPTLISVPATNNIKYIRASRYSPSNEVCNLLLKEIRHAKNVFAREKRVNLVTTIGDMDIFGPAFEKPVCPTGGFYTPGKLGLPPHCGYGHVLEEPR